MKIRTFVAIELPGELTGEISSLQERLKRTSRVETKGVSWTRAAGIHLTLKFLGETDPAKVGAIGEALTEAAGGIGPFEVRPTGIGAFPNTRNPRVLWVGVDAPEELNALREGVEDSLAPLGFERDKRKFSPHLTIARVKSASAARALGRAAEESPPFDPTPFTADSFVLMRSELNPRGARYTVLERVRLKTGL